MNGPAFTQIIPEIAVVIFPVAVANPRGKGKIAKCMSGRKTKNGRLCNFFRIDIARRSVKTIRTKVIMYVTCHSLNAVVFI